MSRQQRAQAEQLALARIRQRQYARAAFLSANLSARPHLPFIKAAARYLSIIQKLEKKIDARYTFV